MIVLLLLGAVGVLISLYFTQVFYRLLAPDSHFVPPFCRMEAGACAAIVHHRAASLFGVPNAVMGIAFYALTMIYALAGASAWLASALSVAAWISVAVGVYLTYVLLVQLRTPCPLCLTAHGLNVLIAVMLTLLRDSIFP